VLLTNSPGTKSNASNQTTTGKPRKHRHYKWLSENVALLMSLGEEAKVYLEQLAVTQQS